VHNYLNLLNSTFRERGEIEKEILKKTQLNSQEIRDTNSPVWPLVQELRKALIEYLEFESAKEQQVIDGNKIKLKTKTEAEDIQAYTTVIAGQEEELRELQLRLEKLKNKPNRLKDEIQDENKQEASASPESVGFDGRIISSQELIQKIQTDYPIDSIIGDNKRNANRAARERYLGEEGEEGYYNILYLFLASVTIMVTEAIVYPNQKTPYDSWTFSFNRLSSLIKFKYSDINLAEITAKELKQIILSIDENVRLSYIDQKDNAWGERAIGKKVLEKIIGLANKIDENQ
jgi:hypothetical protein